MGASADQHRRAARGERAEDGRAKRDTPRRRRMPHVGHPAERLAKEPRAERPERIPRGMRHAEIRRRRRQFARVLKTDGRPEGIEIHRKSRDCRSPKRRPIELREKPVLHIRTYYSKNVSPRTKPGHTLVEKPVALIEKDHRKRGGPFQFHLSAALSGRAYRGCRRRPPSRSRPRRSDPSPA